MKAKHSLRAILTIVSGLMLVLNLVLSWAATSTDPPETNYRLSELILYNDDGNSRQVYTYDDCDNLVSLLKQNESDDLWVDVERSTYAYDAFGNVLTKYVENLEEESVEIYTYTRDCNGNVLIELHDYVGWEYTIKTTYEYDCDGHLLSKMIQYSFDLEEYYNDQMNTYTYDEFGNLILDALWIWEGEWMEFIREIYTYDENGLRISWLEQFYMYYEDPPFWMDWLLVTYTYDADGNMICSVGQEGGEYGSMQTNTYDSQGRCLTNITSFWMGYWKEYWKNDYEYLQGQTLVHAFHWDDATMDWIPQAPATLRLYATGEEVTIYLDYAYLVEANLHDGLQLKAEASQVQTVYYGYPPMGCATVDVEVSGGTPPYDYLWDNGCTSQSFEACPAETTTYHVIVSDANGCMAESCTSVEVIDVRCGNKMDKVELCHYPPDDPENCQTICVARSAVATHLAHGDQLGACGIDRSCVIYKSASVLAITETIENEMFLKVYPNPANQSIMVSYMVGQPGKVKIMLTNSLGQSVNTLIEGDIPGGEIQDMEVNLGHLQPGVYVLILQQSDGNLITEKLMIQK